jgi:hypothetical protein
MKFGGVKDNIFEMILRLFYEKSVIGLRKRSFKRQKNSRILILGDLFLIP